MNRASCTNDTTCGAGCDEGIPIISEAGWKVKVLEGATQGDCIKLAKSLPSFHKLVRLLETVRKVQTREKKGRCPTWCRESAHNREHDPVPDACLQTCPTARETRESSHSLKHLPRNRSRLTTVGR